MIRRFRWRFLLQPRPQQKKQYSVNEILLLFANQVGNKPTLIRIETNAGHGAGKPVSKTIEEMADIFAFTLYNMGVRELKQ